MKRIIRAGERWGVKDRKKRKICRKRQRKVERYEERGRESYTVYVERVIVMWEDICSKRQRGGNLNKMRDRETEEIRCQQQEEGRYVYAKVGTKTHRRSD